MRGEEMANGNIKGITIQLDADTTGLDSALKDVNKQAKNLQTELKEVERGLKLDPGNVELVRQKQQLLTQSIEATSDKLHVLRQAQGQVEQQFRNGQIGEEQYRAFRRELVNTENNMRSLQGQFNSLQTEQQRLADTTRSLGAFFDATGTNVEEFAGTLGTRLTQAIRNGTASADQMERALRLMGRQALGAGTDINQMREELNRINNGGSIDDVRQALQRMGTQAVSVQSELKEIDALLKFNPNSVELLAQKQQLLQRSVSDTTQKLQELRQQQAQVEAQFASGNMGEEAYRAFQRELEQTEQSLTSYKSQINAMQAEQQQLQTSTRHLQALFDATGTTVDQYANVIGNDLVNAIREGRASSTQIEQAIRQIGQQAFNTEDDLERLRTILASVDDGNSIDNVRRDIEQLQREAAQSAQAVDRLGDRLQSAGGRMQSAGSDIASSFGASAIAIGAGMGVAVKKSMEFEAQLSRVGAIAGATKEELQALRESALELGASTSKSASEIAQGQESLAALGFTVNDILGSMPGVISAAEASGADMAQTAEVMASTLNIFGLEAAQAAKVADILAQTANVSAADITDMQYALKYAGPPANALGISLEELAASIGIMTNAGMKGEQAGTTLRAALLGLLDPSEENSKLMNKMGIQITDAQGNFVGLTKLVENLTASMEGQTETQKAATLASLVGTEAVSGMLSLMAAGPAEIQKMTKSLEESGGASSEAAAQMKDNLKGALDELGGAFETMAISIGTALTPAIEALAQMVKEIADKFNELSPGMQSFLVIGAAVTTIVLGIVGAIGVLLAVVGAAVTGFGAIATALGGITAPVAIAVAAIAALIAGGIALYANWEKIMELSTPLKAAILSLNPGLTLIVGAIKAVQNAFSPAIEAGEEWKGKVSEATAEALGSFMELSNGATVALNQMNWSGQAVTQDMAKSISETFANMGNQVLAEMQSDHQEQLTALQTYYANSSVLTDDQEAKALAKAQTNQQNRQQVITDGMARVNEILTTAYNEQRQTTLAEEAEIDRIKKQMQEAAIQHMSESAEEQKVILESLKQEASEITAAQAAEVVKNSVKQKEDRVAEAQKQYEEELKIIMQQRDELGVISEEQAQLLINEAKRTRDKTIESAEEMHTNIVAEAKTQAEEHVEQVDWTTGELKSKWQVMKDDTIAKMKETGAAIKRDWTNAYNDTVATLKRMASDVGKWFQNMNDTVVTKVKGVVDSVIKGMSDAYNGAVKWVGDMASNLSTKFESIKSNATTIFNNTKNAIVKPIEAARDLISAAIDKIKGFFSGLSLKFPKIEMPKLPHFKLTGSFSLNPPSVPKLGIDWYAKGGIMTRPTAFGMNGNNLMIGGEAGPEAILPLNARTLGAIGEGIAKTMSSVIEELAYSSEMMRHSSDQLQEALSNAHASLESSANKSQAHHITQQQIIKQGANVDMNPLIAAIVQLASRPVETAVNLDGRALANVVSNHQSNDYSHNLRLLGLKG